MTPRRLEQFELLEEIGAGGMGLVYRARDLELDRFVAIKLLKPATEADPAQRRRLLAEARAASALNHPGIVTIFQVGCVGDVDFIAMELVSGQTLRQLLTLGPLEPARTVRLAVAVGEALAYAHDRGVVHRDLKPDNVMLPVEGGVKILDFGLAKRFAPLASGSDSAALDEDLSPTWAATADERLLGTPSYMSPEQAQGKAVDPRSDIFSFGGMLYEMLSGERPFRGDSVVALLSSILRDTPTPLRDRRPGLSAELVQTIERALSKRPSDRQPNVRALLDEIRPLVTMLDTAPTQHIAPLPTGGWRHRLKRSAWVAVATSAAVLGAALAIYLSSNHGSKLPKTPQNFRRAFDLTGSFSQPSFAPDGRMLAYTAADAEQVMQVWVKAFGEGPPLQVTSGPVAASRPRWSSRGEIIFGRRGSGVWAVSPLGGTPRQVLAEGYQARVSHDGSRLVFVDNRQLWSSTIDGDGLAPVAGLDAESSGGNAPALSPDGSEVAFFRALPRRPMGDIWIMPLAGGAARQLTSLEFVGGEPVWTPDGRWIIFSSDHGGSQTLWRVAATGGEPIAVTSGAGEDREPEVSADGKLLAYTNARSEFSVELLDPATGARRTLCERRNEIAMPELSPTGDRLAFFARSQEGTQIFTLDLSAAVAANGRPAEPRQITQRKSELNTHPRWSGDGKSIYFYQDEPGPSFRKMSADGGPSTAVNSWNWTDQFGAQLSPDDRFVVLTKHLAGQPNATVVHELESGREWTLGQVLRDPRWAADGTGILGHAPGSDIWLCPRQGDACTLLGEGSSPRFATDGPGIYFLRARRTEVWRDRLDGSGPAQVATIDGNDPLTFRWAVLPSGEILWNRSIRNEPEVWIADLE